MKKRRLPLSSWNLTLFLLIFSVFIAGGCEATRTELQIYSKAEVDEKLKALEKKITSLQYSTYTVIELNEKLYTIDGSLSDLNGRTRDVEIRMIGAESDINDILDEIDKMMKN